MLMMYMGVFISTVLHGKIHWRPRQSWDFICWIISYHLGSKFRREPNNLNSYDYYFAISNCQ
jgi:hypothetical protein